jgi:Fe2+ or Zn2+ uptake regulation protein
MGKRADELNQRLKRRGFRITRQREIVLQELSRSNQHLRADELYELVKKRLPHVSFGTIYRSLKILQELGMARELNFGRCFSRFEATESDHQHFICTRCCAIIDIDQPVVLHPIEMKIAGHEVKVERYQIEFYGICQECQGSNISEQ